MAIIDLNEKRKDKQRERCIKQLEGIDYSIMNMLQDIDEFTEEEVIEECKERLYENCSLIIGEVLGEEELKKFTFLLELDFKKSEFEFIIFYKGRGIMSRGSNIYTHGEKVYQAFENKSYILK